MKIVKKRTITTPKANAAISSSVDSDAVNDENCGSLGNYGEPH
jgi:hypothetical protein